MRRGFDSKEGCGFACDALGGRREATLLCIWEAKIPSSRDRADPAQATPCAPPSPGQGPQQPGLAALEAAARRRGPRLAPAPSRAGAAGRPSHLPAFRPPHRLGVGRSWSLGGPVPGWGRGEPRICLPRIGPTAARRGGRSHRSGVAQLWTPRALARKKCLFTTPLPRAPHTTYSA